MTPRYEKTKIRQGYAQVIGCDEVGRGSLAGPVVAAAVILPTVESHQVYKVIKDSKVLTSEVREKLSAIIKEIAIAWSIGEVSPEIVDEINIHRASLLAMKKAVDKLLCHCEGVHPTEAILLHQKDCFVGQTGPLPSPRLRQAGWPPRNDTVFLFVDGKFKVPNLQIEQEAIIAGDSKVLSVAAASIIAKVYRDQLMTNLHQRYPIYNFARHKGYATEYHRTMIIEHGLSPVHRVSFCQALSI